MLGTEVYSDLPWMTGSPGIHVVSDARWAELEPLINKVRPPCKVPHDNLRQTIEAIGQQVGASRPAQECPGSASR